MGEVGVALEAGPAFTLNLGITLAQGAKKFGISIEEKPSIVGKASIGGSVAFDSTAESGKQFKREWGVDYRNITCYGVKLGLDFKNELSLKFMDKKLLDLTKPLEKNITDGYIEIASMKPKESAAKRSIDAHSRWPSWSHSHSRLHRRQDNSTGAADNSTYLLTLDDLIDHTAAANASAVIADLTPSPYDLLPYNTTDVTQYITLSDVSNSYLLVSCSDGNIYIQDITTTSNLDLEGCSILWSTLIGDDTFPVVADGTGSLIHYYTNIMSAIGVSRLRVLDATISVNSSEYIYFGEYYDDSMVLQYLPTDLSGGVYNLAVCTYVSGTPSKIFLVADISTGLDVLKSEDTKYSITGGGIDDCYAFPLFLGNQQPESAWNGIASDLAWSDGEVEDFDPSWYDSSDI